MNCQNLKKFLFMVSMCVFAGCVIAGDNLISNSNFETDADSDNWPDDWGNASHLSWESEKENHFVRIKSPESGKMFCIYRVVDISKDAKAVEVSFKGRVTDLEKGSKPWYDARVIINFLGKNKKKLGSMAINFNKNTKGWIDKKYDFPVPEGATKLELLPAVFKAKTGTFDIDDMKITALDAEEFVKLQKEKAAKAEEVKKRLAALVDPQVPVAPKDKLPPELVVVGNKLKTKDGKDVWLQGVSIASMEWCATGQNILKSVDECIDKWNSNCIRLPIKDKFWFGKGKWQRDGGAAYRQLVDDVVNSAGARGVYVVLDLHRFRAPKQIHADFWKEVATKYKNHPAVMFEVFNEPHDVTWEVWRDGGFVTTKKTNENVAAENNDKLEGFKSIGIQKLIDVIRETGAKNIVIPGGLDWSYDLSGILNGYELNDRGGNGIMLSTHVYPWKSDWQKCFLDAAANYPIFIGEVGCQVKPMPFQKNGTEDPHVWAPDMLGLIQKYKLNWTAWCFHPSASPCVLSDWDYTPTPYWGKYVKETLAGKQFEMKKMR